MKILPTDLDGVFIVRPNIYKDKRGYFLETFRQSVIEEYIGKKINFVQDNESFSHKGVLRGLHYQIPPFAQAKLVRVIKGKIFDVAVDVRRSSPTFGRWVGVVLDDEKKEQLFIPQGFAHGFLVLSDEAIVTYKVDNYYAKDCDRGIRFDDPAISIDWPTDRDSIILSDKDLSLPYLKDAEVFE